MSSRTKRLRIGVVLNEDVEAHIADYLAIKDLFSLRTTERTARHRCYSGNRVGLPRVVRGVRHLHGILQCYRLVNSIDAELSSLDDEGLQHIARHCPQLSSLDLGGCENITDVTALGQCPQLSSLVLRDCKITDVYVTLLSNKKSIHIWR